MAEQMDLYLPLTPDGSRTFQVRLGSGSYAFRSYYAVGFKDLWFLDVMTAEGEPLAVGRRLIAGSTNVFKGYANDLEVIAATVLIEGIAAETDPESPGATLHVVWYADKADCPFIDGDPMFDLQEHFRIAQLDT